MKFKIFFLSFLLLAMLIPAYPAGALSFDDAYKGIVKIYTYYEDGGYHLAAAQTGSGVVIDARGIVLTNEHVVTVKDGFDEELPVAFKICLTTNTTDEPVCTYSANLIAKDEKQDVALLKIQKAGIAGLNSFYSLTRATKQDYEDGDVVESLGYPSSGGSTITGALGTISGTLVDDDGLTWIKNSAVTSFGSSGGALINLSGDLVGLTSAANASLGYAIDITALNSWIDNNLNKNGTISVLQDRMNNLITTNYSLQNNNEFSNYLPSIQMTKPESWDYNLQSENSIVVDNAEDSEGGTLSVSWGSSDYYAEPMLDATIDSMLLTGNYFSAGEMEIGGKTGKKLISHYDGEEVFTVLLPSVEYYIDVSYYYGKDKVDQDAIDGILASMSITDDNNNFSIQTEYENEYPAFTLEVGKNWSLKPINNASFPVSGQYALKPNSSWSIRIGELTDTMQSLNKEDYFEYIKDDEMIKTDEESSYGLKAVRYFESFDYRINNEFPSEIHYKYRFKDEEDNDKIKTFAAGYRILEGDRVIILELSYTGDDEDDFEALLDEFEKSVLSGFSMGKEVVSTEENPATEEESPETPSQPDDSKSAEEPEQNQTPSQEKEVKNVGKNLIGRIIIQVEANGEAWYLCPDTEKAHYLGRPADAFAIMRELGLGISEDSYNSFAGYAPEHLAGKILLRVEANGEAYYVDPVDLKLHYLGRPADAFQVMRELGLGISNANFDNL